MKISEEKYNLIFNWFLCIISATLIFREFSTILIIFFVVFNLAFFNKLELDKTALFLILIISSPFIINLLFLWNNDVFSEGLKALEKYSTLLFFPLLIIGYFKRLNLVRLIKFYVLSTTVILLFLLVRYIILFNDNFIKYINGVYPFQMGYDFSNSFGAHAPALNMHISFVFVLSIYLFLKQEKIKVKKGFYFFISIILMFFLLYVNTRVAIVNGVICAFLVIFMDITKKEGNILKVIKKMLYLGIFITIIAVVFVSIYPRLIYKFSEESFTDINMIGKIDQIKKPETKHGSLVVRLSIWKSAINLAKQNYWIGFGASDAKGRLVEYFRSTNQKYLAKVQFQTHNQYLDFLLKFGALGLITTLVYIFFIVYLGLKLNNSIVISFFFIFFISNMTDDFLIRYDGIAFSGLWISIFANQYKYKLSEKEN